MRSWKGFCGRCPAQLTEEEQGWGGMSHEDGRRGRNHLPESRETGLLCSPSMPFPCMFYSSQRHLKLVIVWV